jgi:hypothetical protein
VNGGGHEHDGQPGDDEVIITVPADQQAGVWANWAAINESDNAFVQSSPKPVVREKKGSGSGNALVSVIRAFGQTAVPLGRAFRGEPSSVPVMTQITVARLPPAW